MQHSVIIEDHISFSIQRNYSLLGPLSEDEGNHPLHSGVKGRTCRLIKVWDKFI